MMLTFNKALLKNLFLLLVFMLSLNFAFGQSDCENLEDVEPTVFCDPESTVCELAGFCSTMPPPSPGGAPTVNICGQNIALDNPHWFGFVATSNCVSITITPSNCQGTPGGFSGLQGAIVSGCPTGSIYPTIGNCVANPCTTNPFTLSSCNFVIGQQYFIMLDGCAGDICDYEITDATGLEFPEITPDQVPTSASISGITTVCPGQTAEYFIDNPVNATVYSWEINGIPYESDEQTVEIDFTGFSEGTYDLCLVTAENPCASVLDAGYSQGSACITITVENLPDDDRGQVIICEENLPFVTPDDIQLSTPGENTYTILSAEGCDITVIYDLEIISNDPEDQQQIVCPGEFPIDWPGFGPITDPGEYFVEIQDQFACDSSYSVDIQQIDVVFDGFLDSYILDCPSNSIEINAQGVNVITLPNGEPLAGAFLDYEWFADNGQSVGNGPILSVMTGGDYSLRVTVNYELSSCVFEHIIFVEEQFREEVFEPEISFPLQGCEGQQLQITIEGWDGISEINWLPGFGFDYIGLNEGQTVNILLGAPISGAELCVEFIHPDCQAYDAFNCFPLDIGSELELQVTGDRDFCEGESSTLEVQGNYNPGDVLWSTGDMGLSITVEETGTYTVTVTDDSGCTGELAIDATELSNPNPTISGSTSFCTDLSTTISVSTEFESYEWSTGETTQSIVVNETDTYSVTVVDENGCVGETEILVEEREELTPVIAGPDAFCEGETINLDAGNFEGYEWSTGSDDRIIEVSEPGEYSVTVTDSGCEGETSIMITENANPSADITALREGLCPDEATTLEGVEGDFTYLWSTDATTQNIEIDESGEYFLTITDDNGCTDVASIEIEAFDPPDFTIDGIDFFCLGNSTELNVADDFESYQWSSGQTTQSVTINEPGIVSVTVTDNNNCTNEASIEVDELDLPSPAIVGEFAFCAGLDTDISVEGNFESVEWNTGETTETITVSTPGVFSVEVEDEFGCINSTDVQIIENPLPNPTISGATTFCIGFSSTLDAGNYESYLWSDGSEEQTLLVDTEGEYCVTVVDANGCIGETCVFVNEDEQLSFTITGDRDFCEDESTTLDAGNFTSFEWSTGSSDRTITVNTPGTYTVTVSDSDGCTGESAVEIEENPLPVVEITGPSTFCTGQSATLSIDGDFNTIVWSSGGITNSINVTEPGTYSVEVTDNNGCRNSDQFFIEQLDELSPGFSGDDIFCEGESTQIIIEEGFVSYEWVDGPEGRIREFTVGGTFTILVTDDSGCTGTSVVTIIESPLPVADAGEDQVLTCRDNEVTIGSQNSTTDNTTIAWIELDNNHPISDPSAATIVTDRPGTYQITVVFNDTGCMASDQVIVDVEDNAIRDATILFADPSCFGIVDGSLEIVDIDGGVEPYTYVLNGEEFSGGPLNNLSEGAYSLLIEDVNGCRFNFDFELIEPEELTVDAGEDLSIEDGESVTLDPEINVADADLAIINWTVNGEPLCPNCPNSRFQFIPEIPGLYQIQIIDPRGCEASDNLFINIRIPRNVYIPSGFSPNGDNINDVFRIYPGRNVSLIKSFKVFDRWGNKMYELNDAPPDTEEGWDGSRNGQELDPAVFIYSAEVEFNDGEVFRYHGEVNLVR